MQGLQGISKMKKEDCPFCSLSKDTEGRTRIIDETTNTLTILSNPALMKGHCLVIPKRHVEKPSELSEEERKELFNQVIKIQELLIKHFSGCDIKENYRPFQKQSDLKVHHLHFHLQPRELFDELYEKSQKAEENVFKKLSKEELEETKRFLLR